MQLLNVNTGVGGVSQKFDGEKALECYYTELAQEETNIAKKRFLSSLTSTEVFQYDSWLFRARSAYAEQGVEHTLADCERVGAYVVLVTRAYGVGLQAQMRFSELKKRLARGEKLQLGEEV